MSGSFSRARHSRLVTLFADRAAAPGSDPKLALKHLLTDLRRQVKWTRTKPQLETAQLVRGIVCTAYNRGWDRDGSLEPLGTSYDDGFKLTLNANAPKNRVRFTQAHELCHTFFYQYVPEIKFYPHQEDAEEERLCNFGAAELLMPERFVRREARRTRPSIEALLAFSAACGVSIEAMFSRLLSLRLWKSELYIWRREPDGKFILDRIIGSKWVPWRWTDATIPQNGWHRPIHYGHSYLEHAVGLGYKQFKSICFDMRREGNALIVLSGVPESHFIQKAPLFLPRP